MRKSSTELSQSRGLKRRPLLRTSSPLKTKNQPRTHIRIGTANGGTSGLSMRYDVHPFLFFGVIGTAWWYLISLVVFLLFQRLGAGTREVH